MSTVSAVSVAANDKSIAREWDDDERLDRQRDRALLLRTDDQQFRLTPARLARTSSMRTGRSWSLNTTSGGRWPLLGGSGGSADGAPSHRN
jgi:hypothetical protein